MNQDSEKSVSAYGYDIWTSNISDYHNDSMEMSAILMMIL